MIVAESATDGHILDVTGILCSDFPPPAPDEVSVCWVKYTMELDWKWLWRHWWS